LRTSFNGDARRSPVLLAQWLDFKYFDVCYSSSKCAPNQLKGSVTNVLPKM